MISFHLGAPGVFKDLPLVLAEVEASRTASDRYSRTQQIFETRVRPYLNSRSKDPLALDVLRSEALTAVQMLPRDVQTVISQPELFGTSAELMRPGKTFPAIERRFGRLSEIFEGRAWTAHLVITNQVDAIWQLEGVAPQRKSQAICGTGLSWSNLVWRLHRSARECDLVVWDFERSNFIAPALVESLLQVEQGKLDSESYQRIAKCSTKPSLDFLKSCSTDEALAIERLDDLYDIDLEKIATIKGVTLMCVE